MTTVARILLKTLVLPAALMVRLAHWFAGKLFMLLRPILRRIDSSAWLSERIDSLSSAMATQRGLPVLVGTGLLVASFVAHGIVVILLVATDDFGANLFWFCIPFTLLHLGLLAGFTGMMLAVPLGQGYKDK